MTSKKGKPKIIKGIKDKNNINSNTHFADYPVFSFKYLQEYSLEDCNDATFLVNFLFRLRKLSKLGWKGIETSNRHSYGTEHIPIKQFKPKTHPSIITPDVDKLCIFRSNGDNRSFAGIRKGNIFEIIYIEAKINDLYPHSN